MLSLVKLLEPVTTLFMMKSRTALYIQLISSMSLLDRRLATEADSLNVYSDQSSFFLEI